MQLDCVRALGIILGLDAAPRRPTEKEEVVPNPLNLFGSPDVVIVCPVTRPGAPVEARGPWHAL